MVHIKGFKKTSLVDYPKELCSTIFLFGCNFRCKFCHNPNLVLRNLKDFCDLDEEYIISELIRRKKNVSSVCITGGEPLISEGIIQFIQRLKSEGFKVKLDTNGYYSSKLKEVIDKKLVDFISMDIKSGFSKYNESSGVIVDNSKIKESIKNIIESGISYEFRTTVVPGIVSQSDIEEIGEMLIGSKYFTLQQFRSTNDMIDNSLKGINPYKISELEKFKEILKKYILDVRVVN